MKIADLKARCVEVIDAGEIGFPLVIPRVSRGEKIRLLPHRGPTGRILNVSDKGKTLAWFDAKELLSFLLSVEDES